jgi:leucyl-tRNA synthetase
MNDAGLVDFREPFTQLRNQGMMVGADGRKMSKSLGNVVTPDSVVATHGADCLRAYILFLGTFDQEVAWSDTAISGIFRFLERVWEMGRETPGVADGPAASGKTAKGLRRALHATVKRVTECVENFAFNTAVAAMMELRNTMADLVKNEPTLTGTRDWYDTVSTLLVTMAPFTPFITEELWEQTGRRAALGLVHRQPWPTWDETALTLDEQTYPVQINGKIRDEITVPVDMDDESIRAIVLERPQVKKYLEGVELKKFIVVRGRLVSLAVK